VETGGGVGVQLGDGWRWGMTAGSHVSARESSGARATGRLGRKRIRASACSGLRAGWLAGWAARAKQAAGPGRGMRVAVERS
jgi:hypothetical protein